MLIDNKIDRYPGAGLGIVTVWDFLQKYAGIPSKQKTARWTSSRGTSQYAL